MYLLQITLQTNIPDNFTSVNKILTKIKKINIFKDILIKLISTPSQKKKIFTVLKSPHVHKKSREQFRYSLFKRKIIIRFSKFTPLLYVDLIIKNCLSNNFIVYSTIIKE